MTYFLIFRANGSKYTIEKRTPGGGKEDLSPHYDHIYVLTDGDEYLEVEAIKKGASYTFLVGRKDLHAIPDWPFYLEVEKDEFVCVLELPEAVRIEFEADGAEMRPLYKTISQGVVNPCLEEPYQPIFRSGDYVLINSDGYVEHTTGPFEGYFPWGSRDVQVIPAETVKTRSNEEDE